MDEDALSKIVIGAAIEVHRFFGPGLLEDPYVESLCIELDEVGVPYEREVRVPLHYKGQSLRKDYFLDLLVGGVLVVECKATVEDHPVYRAQCLTQLKLTNKRLGLVINFGQPTLKAGLHRVVNNLK